MMLGSTKTERPRTIQQAWPPNDGLTREVKNSVQTLVEKTRIHIGLKTEHQKLTSNARSNTAVKNRLGKSQSTDGLTWAPRHVLKREVKHSGPTMIDKSKAHRRLTNDH